MINKLKTIAILVALVGGLGQQGETGTAQTPHSITRDATVSYDAERNEPTPSHGRVPMSDVHKRIMLNW